MKSCQYKYNLPDKFHTVRQHQHAMTDLITDAFESHKFVMLDAPVGTGKTLLAEMVRQRLGKRSLFITPNKNLQDQFVGDFSYAYPIKGRANYPTANFRGKTCDECTWHQHHSCKFCEVPGTPAYVRCPYMKAVRDAIQSDVVVANTSYALCNLKGGGGIWGRRDIVIVDEVDGLEKVLLDYLEYRFPTSQLIELGITELPMEKTWETRNAFMQDIKRRLPAYLEVASDKKYAKKMADRMLWLPGTIGGPDWMWYVEPDTGDLVVRPIRVNELIGPLWESGVRFLFMSGTVISPTLLAKELGVPEGEYVSLSQASLFDPRRHPIFIQPVARMSKDAGPTALAKMASAVNATVNKHPDERVLVHTVSYELCRYLGDSYRSQPGNKRPIMVAEKSGDSKRFLAVFKKLQAAVLFAPGLERGISLDNDLCRVQVVPKVPYPNKSEVVTKERVHGKSGSLWYSLLTIRTIVQMVGRAMRGPDDFCRTYILDSAFLDLWKKYYGMFPDYFRNAAVVNGSDPLTGILEEEA